MDSEDVTTGVVMAAVKGRRGRGRGARGGTAVPAKAVGIVPVKTAGRGRPKGSGRKQKLLETEVETVVAVPLPLPNEEIPGIVASTSDSSELLIGSDDSKQIPKSPIQSPTTIDNSKLLSGSIESIDKKEDITLTPTTTIDMDADISQLEAPKFTTISRGPPEPMLRLKWDHTVSLIGEKVLNPMIHCCDQCEKPILIYGRMIPCKHVFCLKCARAEPQKQCLRCKDKVMRVEQSGLGTVFMCTHGGSRYGNTGCRRTYLSQRDLQAHINHRHVTVVATANTDSKSVNAKVMTANVARDVRKTDQSQPIQTPSQPHLTSGNNGNPGAGSGLRQRQPSQSFSSNQSNIPITPSGTGSLPARNNLITIPIQESAQSADVEMSSSHHLSGLVTGNVNVHQQQTSIQHNQSQPMDMSTSNYYNSNQSIQSTGNYGQYSTNSNITSIIQSHHQFMGAGGNSGPNIGGGQTGNPISLLQQTGLVHQMRSQIMMPQSGQSVTNSGFFSSGYGQQQPQNLTSNNQQSYQQELMFQQQQQQQQQQAAQMSSGMQRNYHSNEQQQQQAWNQQQYYR